MEYDLVCWLMCGRDDTGNRL